MAPMNIRREPTTKPHMVVKAITEAIRTTVDPVLTLSTFEEFIQKIPTIAATIATAEKAIEPAIQLGLKRGNHIIAPPPIIDIIADQAFHINEPIEAIKVVAKIWNPMPTADNV